MRAQLRCDAHALPDLPLFWWLLSFSRGCWSGIEEVTLQPPSLCFCNFKALSSRCDVHLRPGSSRTSIDRSPVPPRGTSRIGRPRSSSCRRGRERHYRGHIVHANQSINAGGVSWEIPFSPNRPPSPLPLLGGSFVSHAPGLPAGASLCSPTLSPTPYPETERIGKRWRL